MAATKYFVNPFAVAGDVSPIPDGTQPSGAVSYQQGFTVDYELVQTDPSSRDVPRNQFNQLMLDVTSNVQQYQQVGAPNFITTAQNGGVPYPYGIYAVVVYDDGVNGPRKFMSKKNTNTSLPTVTADWLFINNTSGATVIDNAALDAGVVTSDAVYYDSTSSTFKKALANGAAPQKVIGFAEVSSKRVFMNGIAGFLFSMTPGSTYYLSTTVPGQITLTIPANNAVAVGVAKSATELMINVQPDSFNPADLFSATLSPIGYEMNNETGKIIQWGFADFPVTGTSSTDAAVTFLIPFPTNVLNLQTSIEIIPLSGNVASSSFRDLTNSGFTMTAFSNGTFVGTSQGYWQAIGH